MPGPARPIFADMPRTPLKRHPQLIPISRGHHHGLVLAQLLSADVPDYKGLPNTLQGKAVFARQTAERHLFPGFEWIEKVLVPALPEGIEREQVIREQKELSEQLANLPECPSEASLNELGEALKRHIRYKERSWFMAVQARLGEDGLRALPSFRSAEG